MTVSEDVREHFAPLAEVWIGHSPAGHERLFIGEIEPEWIEGHHGVVERRLPVKRRSAEEMLDWIETCPDELNRAMDADLREALGSTVDILEWYPPLPEEIEEIAL